MSPRMLGLLLVLLGAPLLRAQEDKAREVRTLLHSAREKSVEAAKLLREAHADLDRGAYEEAVAEHRRSRELTSESDILRARAEAVAEAACRRLLPDLDDADAETRDVATRLIVALGPAAKGALADLPSDASPEVRARVAEILSRLQSFDEEGNLHQWAIAAGASSEYSNPPWAAAQATGPPDTPQAGDRATAWASKPPDGGTEWIELTYDAPVVASAVRVRETYNPGAVVKIEGKSTDGAWRVLWEGKDSTAACPGWLEVRVGAADFEVTAIRLTLDNDAVPGWNEIDAVELIGEAR